MAVLHVENVPDEVYESLRRRAKEQRTSIRTQVIELLTTFYPTKAQLERRERAYRRLLEIQAMPSPGPGPFPSTEEMIREMRNR